MTYLVEKTKKNLAWLYMQYSLMTATYVMEPFEVIIFNVVILIILATATYSGCVYMPQQMHRIIFYIRTAYLQMVASNYRSLSSTETCQSNPLTTEL